MGDFPLKYHLNIANVAEISLKWSGATVALMV